MHGSSGSWREDVEARPAVIGRRVEVLRLDQVAGKDFETWRGFRAGRGDLRSPFFSPEFSQAVQRARGDVELAVVRENDEPIGFLPFHRVRNTAYPVGRFINDAHNVIAEAGTSIDWMWLLKQIGVRAFDFHAMTGTDVGEMSRYVEGTIQSFRAEVGEDSREFLRRLGKQHKTIGRQGQKTRKMAREIGPVEFEFDCRDPSILMKTIGWKRQQYQRTHILDLFSTDWTIALMHELFSATSSASAGEHGGGAAIGPRGILSVMRAGDHVVSAHYGIIENGLLHYWFPAYDPEFGRYSPGTALFSSILRDATENGLTCVDMGYGEQPYKVKQTDTISHVTYGSITSSKLHRGIRLAESTALSAIRKLPLKEPLKRVWRRLQPQSGISKLD